MKRFIITLSLAVSTIGAWSMPYNEARENAIFLTNKLARELHLNRHQWNEAYEVNLRHFLALPSHHIHMPAPPPAPHGPHPGHHAPQPGHVGTHGHGPNPGHPGAAKPEPKPSPKPAPDNGRTGSGSRSNGGGRR